ncbi:MAG: MucB/RseB C-terminal domain-containing protein [Gammaproteobacteria bacterium]
MTPPPPPPARIFPVAHSHRAAMASGLLGCLLGCMPYGWLAADTRTATAIPAASATAGPTASPTDWLMKINRAAAELSFSGVFVHASGGEVEAMQVVRRVRDDMVQERLYSLSGEKREIVRDSNRIWCYLPQQNFGMRDDRQAFQSGFPRILPGDLGGLMRNYHFTEGGRARIADRIAHQVNVLPNDGFRYGYRLWADVETGLLLRSDLIGEEGGVIDQYLFVTINIGGEISDRALEAVTAEDKLVWYEAQPGAPKAAQDDATPGKSHWRIARLPAGYRLRRHIHRVSPTGGGKIEHLIITDGLSTVSVFIKPAAARDEMTGLSRMGSVHIYRSRVGGHLVTVMGETPARTVELLAAGIAYRR